MNHVSLHQSNSSFSGESMDMSFGGGKHADILISYTRIREHDSDYPASFTMLEAGFQYRTGGRWVEGVFGGSMGLSARGLYDDDELGGTFAARARFIVWPLQIAGVFAEGQGRFLNGPNSISPGLMLGVTLRTRP